MDRKIKTIAIAAVCITTAIASSFTAKADEGMWMIHAINSALEKKMQERGLELSANEIYNADAEGATISDAIVSLDFGCTGSIISDKGLLITTTIAPTVTCIHSAPMSTTIWKKDSGRWKPMKKSTSKAKTYCSSKE